MSALVLLPAQLHAAILPAGTWTDLFTMSMPVVDKAARTVLVYLAIAVLLRVAGKRLLAQMNNLDLVVVLLLSNVVQNAIIGPDDSVTGGLLGAVILLAVNAVADRGMQHSSLLRNLLEGHGTKVVEDGRVIEGALERLGTSRRELSGAIHHQGADAVSEVASAVVEPGGAINVLLKREEQNVSKAELDAAEARIMAAIASLREQRATASA